VAPGVRLITLSSDLAPLATSPGCSPASGVIASVLSLACATSPPKSDAADSALLPVRVALSATALAAARPDARTRVADAATRPRRGAFVAPFPSSAGEAVAEIF